MKVAILGTATSTLPQAPVEDEGWEIWTCGISAIPIPRVTRRFELHPRQELLSDMPEYYGFLGDQTEPVYTLDHFPEWPHAVAYPRQDITDKFGDWFLTSSIAWMLALAVHEMTRGDQIGLWGVEMAEGTEYAAQRPGCLHFMRLAIMMGIDVTVPPDSELNYIGKPYPDSFDDPYNLRARRRTVEAQIAGLKAEIKEYNEALLRMEGQLETIDSLQRQRNQYDPESEAAER